MFKYYYFFLVLLFLAACGGAHKLIESNPQVKNIQLLTLETNNLSEDMNAAASQNDEILLLIYLIDTFESSEIKIQQQVSFPLTFDASNRQHTLDQLFTPPATLLASSIMVFVLIEQDNDDTQAQIEKTIRTYVHSGVFLKKVDKLVIDKLLPYDDFLGLKYIPWSDFTVPNEISIRFNGLHLFDKYEYLIRAKTF